MVQVTFFRTRKICYLLLCSLAAGIYVLTQHRGRNTIEDLDIPPEIGIELPNLNDFHFHSESASQCKSNYSRILIIVHSSPSHIPHRAVIRLTWGSAPNVRTLFVVGESSNNKVRQRVLKEAEDHGDLILPLIADSYKNLTLKHLLWVKWSLENCPDTSVVLKTDDDAFLDTIRIPRIVNLTFGASSASTNALICHVIPEGSVPKRSGKWKVTREEYPFEEYPEYCSGIAYMAQLSTMRKIFDLAPSVPYLPIDDVFVTGLAATFAGVKRQDLGVRFANTEQSVIEWMRSKTLRPCPWMVAEISPYYWPTHALQLWNKTVKAWHKSSQK